jgi:hypothetical protein
MATFEPERFDVGADRLGHAQAVQRQTATPTHGPAAMADRRSPRWPRVRAVHVGDMRLVVHLRSTDVYRRRVLDYALFFGVAVEP